MNKSELDIILTEHRKWLINKIDGDRANLRRANLIGADLIGADLIGADLSGAFKCDCLFYQLNNIGSENGALEMYSCGDKGWFIKRGCFSGTQKEFLSAVSETHGQNEHAKEYNNIIMALCGEMK